MIGCRAPRAILVAAPRARAAFAALAIMCALAPSPVSAQRNDGRNATIPLTAIDRDALRARALDELFARLAAARNPEEGAGVAGAIERVWLKSGSDTADLLMERARSVLNPKEAGIAWDLLDRIIALEPQWAEAYRTRAAARFLAGDRGGAVEDLGQALALEPRHFGAMSDLGSILLASGFDKRALDALRRSLELHPQQPDLRATAERLAPGVDGRDI
jgi:tetratricopeptide (TPR) repeat protein